MPSGSQANPIFERYRTWCITSLEGFEYGGAPTSVYPSPVFLLGALFS